jgi:acetyl esterase/lipase
MCAATARADGPAFGKKTHVYKTVGATKIECDVYRAEDDAIRPVVIWIHGGALITGSKNQVPANLLDLCKTEGFALISLNYRLAPEVKSPAIIEDIEDAFRWLSDQGPKLLHIDPSKVVVTGGSAGGYLTLMSGFRVKPTPTALVAYWGYGDVDGDWLSKPSEHYRKTVPHIEKDEALKGVGSKILTEAGPDVSKARGRYYLYLRQNGFWTKEVTGFDASERKKLDPLCPVRNVTAKYPPTMLVHGTEDTDVPYSLSVDMDKELTQQGVKHEFVTVKGAGHGLSGGDKKLVADAQEKAVAFVREHLKPNK